MLDTNVLHEVLRQFFDADMADRGRGRFAARYPITASLARRLNRLVADVWEGGPARVVTSTAAFVEMARKWDEIVGDRFTVADVLLLFLEQVPEWFVVAAVDEDLLPYLADLPCQVSVGRGRQANVEFMDAIHAATVHSRGDRCLLATTDATLKALFHDRLAT